MGNISGHRSTKHQGVPRSTLLEGSGHETCWAGRRPAAPMTALALGVATLGSLFLALAGGGGIRNGFLVVIAVQVIAAVGVAAGARRLPDRRRAPR
jgi:hypothetical protein